MAWRSSGNNLQFVEGDWGIAEIVKILGLEEVVPADSFKFTFKTKRNGDLILEKVYTDLVTNLIELVLTEAETQLFPVGTYVYSLDWFQNGNFMCNIVDCATLKVVDKA